MHTPGGPLKYSLEGHQFAIFAMKLSSDNRYIISCSNKFITFDVVTSDLARQVYPKVEGLMIGLELSPDNKFAAAYTNNNQTVLLNTLISEFVVIENFLSSMETVQVNSSTSNSPSWPGPLSPGFQCGHLRAVQLGGV